MKKLIFTIIIMLAISCQFAFAQTWTAQSSGTTNSLYGSYFVDANTGWAVGRNGTILKTTNGGTNWTAQTSGRTSWLYDIHFVSSTTGWVVGYTGGTILKTTNGGTNWTAQTSGTTKIFWGVHFVSSTTGWIVGGSGTILKTTNGGTNWTSQSSGTTQFLLGVHFVSSTTGWAVGASGTIRKTTNGGTNWTGQSSGTTQSLLGVHFVSSTTGWAVGGNENESSGTILKTTNGGTNWTEQSIGNRIVNSISIGHSSYATIGWAVGGSGTIRTSCLNVQDINNITPLNSQNQISTKPIFRFSRVLDENEIIQISTSSNFANNVQEFTFDGTYFEYSNHLKNNTTYYYRVRDQYGRCGNTPVYSFTTEPVKTATAWEWKNPYPTGNHLRSIKYFDTDEILTLGDLFSIIRTTNGGTNWDVRRTGNSNNINSVHFPPYEDIGYAPSDNGTIYKTTDKGETWIDVQANINTPLFNVWMADINAGWCVGKAGTVVKTTNGGNAWSNQSSGVTTDLWGIYFANLNVGWIVGENGVIRKTTNGGVNWTGQSSGTTNDLYGTYFTSMNNGIAYGAAGTLLRTTNGGDDWSSISLSISTALRAAYFVNSNTGFLVGDASKIYKTTNGGANWSLQEIEGIEDLYSVSFLDVNNGIIGGAYGTLLKTTNGGSTWSNLKVDAIGNKRLNLVHFIDDNNGYIANFPTDQYLKTTNAGANWFTQSIEDEVNHFYFINSSTGWTAGDEGKIYKTTNAGIDWEEKNSNTTVDLRHIHFISTSVGWVVGDNGYLLKTTNGGNSWVSQNVGTTKNYTHVYFKDANLGWILTLEGDIMKSTNGGSNWSVQTNPAEEQIIALHILEEHLGWGICADGYLIRTVNGGTNWSKINTGYTRLKSVFFVDSLNGWASGDRIIRSFDGGLTWVEQGGTTINPMYSLYFHDVGDGWAVGDRGTILKYDNSAIVVLPPSLSAPQNNATNVSLVPQFDWTVPNNAEYYRLQVSTNENFTTFVFNDTLSTNTKKIPYASRLGLSTNYFWRVKAYSSLDSSLWSNAFKFTTQGQLQPPALATPANNATGISINPTFTWNSASNAERYVLQISTSVTFSNLIVNDTTENTSRAITVTLDGTTNYFWRVRAINEGQVSDWANYRGFTTEYIGLPVPTLTSPANNATSVNNSPTLNWNSVSGATAYRVQISTNQNFTSFTVNTTSNNTNYAANNLGYFTSYYWRIRAVNSTDSSNFSQVWTFKTKDQPLAQVNLSSPNNNATAVSLNPTLSWTALNGATNYDIQVSTSINFSSFVVNQTGVTATSYNLTSLNTFTEYYWRVRGKNNTETGAWSDGWKFRTVSQPLGLPTLTNPANNATSVATNPTMQWSSVSGATHYDIQVSTNSNFSSTVINQQNLTATSYSASGLQNSTQYYWRVRAKNSEQTGDWTSGFNFTTIVAPPQTPTLTSPANNSEDVATNVTVSWNTVQNATSYKLQIADNNGFTNPLVDVANITATEYQTSGLGRSSEYFWRVRAVNAGGESAWSSVWSFETMEADPVPSSWDFTDLTGNNSIVVLPLDAEPQIEDRDFQKGDAVGFFFDLDGDLVCAGYSVWNNENMAITVWGDDQETEEKDGYVHNETYKVKIWDGQLGRELNAEFTFSFGSTKYSNNGYSIFGSLKGISTVTQTLSVVSGWNMISGFIIPENDSLKVMFNDNLEELVLLKNNAGQVFIPQYNINTIGQWQYKQGYQAFMSSSGDIELIGMLAKPENEGISLASGWSLVAYLRNSALAVQTALQTLTQANKLVLAKNNSGQVYIPQYNINTIGSMQPGQGYQMFLSSAGTLTYPANSLGKYIDQITTPMPKYLIADNQRTGSSAVAIIEIESDFGNEIGIYNLKDELIGSGVVENGYSAVTIWGNNEQTIAQDGATENETLLARLYDTKTRTMRELELHNISDITDGKEANALQYRQDGIFTAKATIKELTADAMLRVTPNPASERVTIEILTNECNYDGLKIYSSTGRLIADLSNSLQELNGNSFTYDASRLPSGEYNVVLSCSSEQVVQKLIIVR